MDGLCVYHTSVGTNVQGLRLIGHDR
jgi:hypothetical protein